jgi:hypothetical protein
MRGDTVKELGVGDACEVERTQKVAQSTRLHGSAANEL